MSTEKTVKAKATKAVETAKEAANETKATLRERFEDFRSNMDVPESAREFVKKTAHGAGERSDDVHEGIVRVSETAEKAVSGMVGGYYNAFRGVIEASKANADHYFATVEKVATAKDVKEAFQIQADFARDYAQNNIQRGRDAIESTRTSLNETVANVQDEMKKVWSFGKKAA